MQSDSNILQVKNLSKSLLDFKILKFNKYLLLIILGLSYFLESVVISWLAIIFSKDLA